MVLLVVLPAVLVVLPAVLVVLQAVLVVSASHSLVAQAVFHVRHSLYLRDPRSPPRHRPFAIIHLQFEAP
jgi:hypothetical protein